MTHPTVTFVIPCYNHGRFVRDAVQSCLRQLDADVRVVVVDDGSDDGSTPEQCDACAGDRVRVVHQENKGLPAARNAGAALADSEYLVFLDADDYLEPTFVRELAGAIEHAGDDVSHAYCRERLTEHGRDAVWRVPDWDPLLLLITNLHPVTALVRRDRFEAVGGFDETMTRGYEDWEFWIRLSGRGWRGVRVTKPLFNWRRHSNDTMIHDAVAKHEELYDQILERHPELYRRHAHEITRRTNMMLRRYDCNWLDETLDPIVLRYLWEMRDAWPGLHDQLAELTSQIHVEQSHVQSQLARAEAAEVQAREAEAAAEQATAMYESMKVVRFHHATHRTVNALPRPLRRLAWWCVGVLKRIARAVRNLAKGRESVL